MKPREPVSRLVHQYEVGAPGYALYCRPKQQAATMGPCSSDEGFWHSNRQRPGLPYRGPTWRRHIDQLQPGYGVD